MRRLVVILMLTAGAAAAYAGNSLNLEAHAGKVVLVDFWASWCVPCRRSFPWMNEMQAKYAGDGLVIIAVNLDRDREEADAFLREYPADFDILYDPEAVLAREYGVEAMPSSIVFDRDGRIAASHRGFKVRLAGEYEALIREQLGKDDER